MTVQEFKSAIENCATNFKAFDKSKPIRVVSHLDADGICSAAIIIKVLNQNNFKYSLSIVQQLRKDILQELKREEYTQYIFTDLGSSQITNIKEILKDKKVIILDHHEVETVEKFENITHINPHLHGIDGSKTISGSGVVYLFARSVDEKNKNLAHLAVIGAIGDVQEESGVFSDLNQEILNNAIEADKIEIKKGLRFFGTQTRPIHKVLEYSTDPFIPGISGSESKSIQFLSEIGINPKTEKGWKKLIDLTEIETKKLAEGIIMKRFKELNPDDVFGNMYLLKDEQQGKPTKDAREFSTLLNACGRLSKASYGIGTCLGDEEIKLKANSALLEYKREIVNALNWYNKNKESEWITKGNGFIIINAQDNILSTIIGTLASILSKSKEVEDNTLILSMAQLIDNTTKVSMRIAGMQPRKDINLRQIIDRIIEITEFGESGGHQFAAGAIIPSEKEKEFVDIAKKVLEKRAMEETI